MRLPLTVAALIFSTCPALANTPLNGTEFDAYVTGKTITYDYGMDLLGVEQYLPGRRVRWAFEGDQCLDGTWFAEADQICFVYENDGVPQCWEFYLRNGGLMAEFMGDDMGTTISEIDQTTAPLGCAGPDVGV